jgi:hypothetical protein
VVERTEWENVLTEALTTAAIIAAKQQQYSEEKKNFEGRI